MKLSKINIKIENSAILNNLRRLTNQIYKLLPSREEGLDWSTPLETIVEELSGMCEILTERQELMFSLLCKLQGLCSLSEDKDFLLYRRTIFDCLTLMSKIMDAYKEE